MIIDPEETEEVFTPIAWKALHDAVQELLRGTETDLDAYLHLLDQQVSLDGKKINIHCHGLLCNQQGPRVNDFARHISKQLVDYSIPRKDFINAKAKDSKYNTDAYSAELREKARALFADVKKSGEGGEMLLYMMIQTYLRLPQLLCKMALKTSSNVHVHGVDGVHVKIDESDGHLILYWGESKLFKKPTAAIAAALKSLTPYLIDEGGSRSPLDRDLFLLRDNLDLGNSTLRAALIQILDRDKPQFNDIEYRGAALVGFDCNSYPAPGNPFDKITIKTELAKQVPTWIESIRKFLAEEEKLASISLEIFLIPFPDVEKFRLAFAKEIGLQ